MRSTRLRRKPRTNRKPLKMWRKSLKGSETSRSSTSTSLRSQALGSDSTMPLDVRSDRPNYMKRLLK